MYDIELDSTVYKDLAKISSDIAVSIRTKVYHNLLRDPRDSDCRKLKGRQYKKLWRFRVNNYRVFYQILEDEKKIIITRIGHRREAH